MLDLQPYILAVDVGTSSLKAVVYDRAGGVMASATQRYPTSDQNLPAGWAEADPHEWWNALQTTVEELKSSFSGFSAIQAVILTGQMHTTVLLDENGEVLPPTILWLDRRAVLETVELQQAFRMPPYQLNSTYSLPKLVWLARQQPEVIKKTCHILWAKDYLRFRLTGEYLTDFTEAGGAALLDWDRMAWASERLEWTGISPSILPPLSQPTDLAGRLRPELAHRWGFNPNVKVLVGAGDVLALVTAAPRAEGQVTCSIGSSSMVYYPLSSGQEKHDPQERIYIYPLLPYRLLGGVSSTSGAAITWAATTFFDGQPFETAITAALKAAPGAGGLFFLPFLSGERSPYWSDTLRGSFYGLTLKHDRQDMLRAVMESVAFSLRYLLEIFHQTSLTITEIALAGGGATIQGLPSITSNICQLPVVIYSTEETVTHGLYAYACQALEDNISFEEALLRTFQQSPVRVQPDPGAAKVYDPIYRQYCHLADFANEKLSRI